MWILMLCWLCASGYCSWAQVYSTEWRVHRIPDSWAPYTRCMLYACTHAVCMLYVYAMLCCTLYAVRCMLYAVCCTLYAVRCMLYAVHCTLWCLSSPQVTGMWRMQLLLCRVSVSQRGAHTPVQAWKTHTHTHTHTDKIKTRQMEL